MKSSQEFLSYYENGYADILKGYYDDLNNELFKLKIIFLTLITISLLAIGTIFMMGVTETNIYIIWTLSGFILLSIILTLINRKHIIDSESYAINITVIDDLVKFITNNNKSAFKPDRKVKTEYFERSNLFNFKKLKYYGKNYMIGLINNHQMLFTDINICTYDLAYNFRYVKRNGRTFKQTSKRPVIKSIFNGIYIDAVLKKQHNHLIYLIPNNFNDKVFQKKIYNYINYHGVKVDLENLEFSKKYAVYSDDETQARYILSLGFMERINKLDELFSGKKYIVFKDNGRFSIYIEDLKIADMLKKSVPVTKSDKKHQKYLLNLFTNVNKLFTIYETLDLDNDLYGEY